jgi:hypothetical protein
MELFAESDPHATDEIILSIFHERSRLIVVSIQRETTFSGWERIREEKTLSFHFPPVPYAVQVPGGESDDFFLAGCGKIIQPAEQPFGFFLE